MAFFQNSVLSRHLNSLDKEKVKTAYKKFSEYFHNPEIQQNIKDAKEEQFQEGFLRELFVNILGYTLNPQPNYNLTTEFKNETGSKKADGAILQDGKALGVIELKGTDTTDLDKINDQAFSYKNNQTNCIYVITSNFEKLRFFIQNSVEHLEFNLFDLDEEQFHLLWLCLSSESIFRGTPLKVKEQSLLKEEDITKQLYKDYSAFKSDLWNNMIKNLPESDWLVLFKRAQKLLDRFLFIFFAEDSGLLPPNSISRIVDNWKTLEELDAYKPLYEIFKQYFGYINKGRKGKKTIDDIFAFNGGLFLPDEILDNVQIDDDVLHPHVMKLTNYDFQSEVDVNILGHIFENSLTEIENITAKLEGQEVDKSKTRRKKDGVYYTPKYITKYIVENTVGRLCEEKKEELGIVDEDYAKGRKHRKKETIKSLEEKLKSYREWLLGITICDPACGSGAFLNQALEFLIAEHGYIDELRAELFGDALVLSDVSNDILERNIYGVDINEESVEIAKLSLWLRTAKRGRKLTSLNNNIKCGNSLIDDLEVAGDKAFDWEKEFPEVFANGGFDVVIGNPPYVAMHLFEKQIHNYFEAEYSCIHTGYNDLMYYFLFKGINILRDSGIFGMITSNYFIGNEYAKGLRDFLVKHVSKIINFDNYHVFDDANIHSCIILAEKQNLKDEIDFSTYNKNDLLTEINLSKNFTQASVNRKSVGTNWIIGTKSHLLLIEKIENNKASLGNISEIAKGSETGKNEVFTIDKKTITKYSIEDDVLKKCVKNSNIDSYFISYDDKYLIYADNDFSKQLYPNAFKYLEEYKDLLLDRRGPRTGEYEWWRLHRPSIKSIFQYEEKILVPYRADRNKFGYDNKQFFNNGGDVRAIKIIDTSYSTKYILAILNSSLINWYYGFIGKPKGKSREYFNKPLSLIPICNISKDNQQDFVNKANLMIENKAKAYELIINFQKLLEANFNIEKPSKKLQNWHELEFKDFLNELKKKKVKLSLSEESEWMNYFNEQKTKALEIKAEIDKTDKEINQMVYELYDLTPEEIRIVEEV